MDAKSNCRGLIIAGIEEVQLFLIRLMRVAQDSTQSGADQLEHATPILSRCHGIFTD